MHQRPTGTNSGLRTIAPTATTATTDAVVRVEGVVLTDEGPDDGHRRLADGRAEGGEQRRPATTAGAR